MEQRQLALRLKARGLSLREIGPQVGCSHELVRLIARGGPRRPQRPDDSWLPGPGRLRLADREEISLGLHAGESFTVIAARLGKAVSTVSREVAGNGGRGGYRAWRAHQRARERARRPKTPKLACPRLAAQVTEWLEAWWSPQEISRRLRIEFAGDPMMWVSHETIYQALYVQGRGELRRELARCLRTGRAKRRPRGRPENTGRIQDMVMISERPAEAADRAVPGHWEGDLIIGENCKSAVGTLVERTTRYVLLLHLPDGRGARQVEQAMQPGDRRPARRAVPHHHLGPGQGDGLPRRSSPSPPASRSTSATRTRPGSAARTRTPTACSASTCPKAPTCPSTPPRT